MHRYEVSSVFMSQDLKNWEFLILGQKKSEFLANKAHNLAEFLKFSIGSPEKYIDISYVSIWNM